VAADRYKRGGFGVKMANAHFALLVLLKMPRGTPILELESLRNFFCLSVVVKKKIYVKIVKFCNCCIITAVRKTKPNLSARLQHAVVYNTHAAVVVPFRL